jgi:hypothetical protein
MTIKKLLPVLLLFALTNAVLIFSYAYFKDSTVFKFNFILVVNLMLLSMSIFNFFRLKMIVASNPNAMVRSVMLGTLIKMVVFAGAALAYATQKKAAVGYPTLLACMGLYLVYTWLEMGWTKIKQ